MERVEVKDVRLPMQLQRAMAAEAEATREAGAKVIAAEGEQKASRALREAAEVVKGSKYCLKVVLSDRLVPLCHPAPLPSDVEQYQC